MPELNSSSKSKARIWNYLGERVRRDFLFQAASGTMPGVSVHHMMGYDSDLGNVIKPIWPEPADYPYFTEHEALSIVSDSTDDEYRFGLGARLVRILGLDYKYELQMEDVPLRGTTVIKSQGEYFRVLEASVIASGGVYGPAGTITIAGSSSLKLVGLIQKPFNRMTNGIFTIPAHTNGYLFNYMFSMGAPKEITVGLRNKSPVVEYSNWVLPFVGYMYGGKMNEEFNIPVYFPERTDIELVAFINVDSDTAITGHATLLLIDETFEWEQITSQGETYGITRND